MYRYHVDFIVLYQCKLLSLQYYILWLCILSMICISKTCFISYWDYIHITCVHKDDKGIRNFNHLIQKANLKHIIFSGLFLSLFIFSLLYPCVSLNFYMFSFPPSQGLVEHILVDISWIMVGNYVKRKKKEWCLMKRWVKLPKVKEKNIKKEEEKE